MSKAAWPEGNMLLCKLTHIPQALKIGGGGEELSSTQWSSPQDCWSVKPASVGTALTQAYGNLQSYIDLLACLNVVLGWPVTWQTWRQKRLKPCIVVTWSQHMALTLPRTQSVKAGAMK